MDSQNDLAYEAVNFFLSAQVIWHAEAVNNNVIVYNFIRHFF